MDEIEIRTVPVLPELAALHDKVAAAYEAELAKLHPDVADAVRDLDRRIGAELDRRFLCGDAD